MRWLSLIILLATGCQTLHYKVQRTPPEMDSFRKISEEIYIKHLYDCSNKSSKYARILNEKGYKADIMVTSVGEGHHAVVVVHFKNGDVLYCDPTQGTWSDEIDEFGKPFELVPFEKRHSKKWRNEILELF